MPVPPVDGVVPEPTAGDGPIVVLAIGDGGDYSLDAATSADERLDVRSVRTVSCALERLDDADCLVTAADRAGVPPATLVERVRWRRPDLPVVFVADDGRAADRRDALAAFRWVDVVASNGRGALAGQLRRRLPKLVERNRLSSLSRRSLAGVELAGDAIAIVGPDGVVEFVNRSFATQFGYDRDALVGRPWRDLFAADTVDRLESSAIPTATEAGAGAAPARRAGAGAPTSRRAFDWTDSRTAASSSSSAKPGRRSNGPDPGRVVASARSDLE